MGRKTVIHGYEHNQDEQALCSDALELTKDTSVYLTSITLDAIPLDGKVSESLSEAVGTRRDGPLLIHTTKIIAT